MEQLTAAIIGMGNIAPMHVKSLNESGIPIAAVCDKHIGTAKEFASTIRCKAYTDYEKMLDEGGFQVLHICLPHHLHARVAIAALQKGYHVLCEKPMATTVADAKAMADTAKQTGRTLGLIFQNRFSPGAKLIKQTLAGGELGPVKSGWFRVTWSRGKNYYKGSDWRGFWATEGGGAIINQSIHCFDLSNHFLGTPTSVNANIANRIHPEIEVEDVAEGVIWYGGVPISFFVTTNHPYDVPASLEIICENGKAELDGEHARITYPDGTEKTALPDEGAKKRFGMKSYWGVSHIMQIGDFYQCLAEGRKHLPDGEEGLRTQVLVNGIYEAAKGGGEALSCLANS